MAEQEPTVKLGAFSDTDAVATEWAQARRELQDAALYWLSTVRPDGRPHVTPLVGVWWDGALYFCTGADERKAKNLTQNPRCILTTGRNTLDDGVDIVVEGEAAEVGDVAELRVVADTYEAKYGPRFTAPEGTWLGLGDAIRGGKALVYRVTPSIAFGLARAANSARPGGRSPIKIDLAQVAHCRHRCPSRKVVPDRRPAT